MPRPKKSKTSWVNNFGRAAKCNPVVKCDKENPCKSAKNNTSCINNIVNVSESVKCRALGNHGDHVVYKHPVAAPADRGLPTAATSRSALTTPLMDITAASNNVAGNKAAVVAGNNSRQQARPVLTPIRHRGGAAGESSSSRSVNMDQGKQSHSVISTATNNVHITVPPPPRGAM